MEIITRYGPPSKLDHAARGTACKVSHGLEFDLYAQIGKDEEDPKWIILGTFNNSTTEEQLDEAIKKMTVSS